MTHEEALHAASGVCPLLYFRKWEHSDGSHQYQRSGISSSDFELMLTAYLSARSAVLCQSTPICWTNLENLETPNLKPRMSTRKSPDQVEHSTFNIPLHLLLKD